MQGRENIDSLLAESFKALVLEESVEKITIKEITDQAGVIRPTFYNHFQDKYELLEWIIRTEVIDPVRPLILGGFVNESVILMFKNIYRDKSFYQRASRLEGQNSFMELCQKCVEELLLELFQGQIEKNQPLKWLTAERLSRYYANSICYVIISWIRSGYSIDPAELSEIYEYVISHSIKNILEELK